MAGHVYSITDQRAYTTAITILELTAGSAKPFWLIRAWITQSGINASDAIAAQIIRSAAGTLTTITTVAKLSSLQAPAAGFTAKRTATVEGASQEVLIDEGFNVLNGFFYRPVPDEEIFVPSSGIIALKLAVAPAASTTLRYGMIVREMS